MSVLYEKGNAPWDIGMILTRHAPGCQRVVNLRMTAISHRLQGAERLTLALATQCTCGVGDSDSERTSLETRSAGQTSIEGEADGAGAVDPGGETADQG